MIECKYYVLVTCRMSEDGFPVVIGFHSKSELLFYAAQFWREKCETLEDAKTVLRYVWDHNEFLALHPSHHTPVFSRWDLVAMERRGETEDDVTFKERVSIGLAQKYYLNGENK